MPAPPLPMPTPLSRLVTEEALVKTMLLPVPLMEPLPPPARGGLGPEVDAAEGGAAAVGVGGGVVGGARAGEVVGGADDGGGRVEAAGAGDEAVDWQRRPRGLAVAGGGGQRQGLAAGDG